jgi:hypothetical protein
MNKYYILIIIITIIIYFIINNVNKKIKNRKSINLKYINVIFCSTVRNIESYVVNGLNNIDICGKKFNDYAVIIYENDSNDKTRELLNKYKKNNYYYIFEDNVTEPRRTMRIANGRNKILDKIKKINKDNYYQYMVMLDLDDVNDSGTFVNSIDTCFKYNNWDVLTGNQSDVYYDLWALRKNGDMDYDCWKIIKELEPNPDNEYAYVWSKHKVYLPNQLLSVDSAFGGIAIYKLSSIPDKCRYIGEYEDGDELCEHVEFNNCIKKNGGKIYINTNFLTN